MYKVLERFRDLTDSHIYNVGDVYPKEGTTPTPERVKELSTKNNRLGKPLIREKKSRKKQAV